MFLRKIFGNDRCGMQDWLNAAGADAHNIAPASTAATAGGTRDRQWTFGGTATSLIPG
jgi:hypothetical protein